MDVYVAAFILRLYFLLGTLISFLFGLLVCSYKDKSARLLIAQFHSADNSDVIDNRSLNNVL